MMIAFAPAAFAFAILSTSKHVPRWTSAMLPAVSGGKSLASQPLVDDGSGLGGSTMSPVGTIFASIGPFVPPENSVVMKSVGLTNVLPPTIDSCDGADSSKSGKSNGTLVVV